MFFSGPLKEIAARNFGIQLPGLAPPPSPTPKAKASAKGKAPPPKGAPPKAKAPAPKAAAPPPKWKGPAPSNDWKANSLVNWKPIREVSRLEGSVWKKLLLKNPKGVAQVPTGLVDDLNNAFMSKASMAPKPRRSFAQRPSVVRLLPKSKALQADILHKKLERSGIRSAEQVAWVTKLRPRPEVTPVQASEEGAEEVSKNDLATDESDVQVAPDSTEETVQTPQEAAPEGDVPAVRQEEAPPEVSPEAAAPEDVSAVAAAETAPEVAAEPAAPEVAAKADAPVADTGAPVADIGGADTVASTSGAGLEPVPANGPADSKADAQPIPEATEAQVAEELSGDVLEALLGLLSQLDQDLAADFKSGVTQAPAELFLQELLMGVDDFEVMRSHVRAALHIARFEEAKSVEVVLLRGIKASRVVIDSKVIPIFLEGVLLVGNYVNSNSQGLSGALGVTLESLANLAHTRTKHGTKQTNALHFVVGHLQRTHPNLVEMLAEDLDECRSLQGLDTSALAEMIQEFVRQVQTVEALVQDQLPETSSMPDALAPARVEQFLESAVPQVKRLTELLKELTLAAADLRRWFAEPAERQLVDMLGSLAQLREALPVAKKAASARKRAVQKTEKKIQRPAPAKGGGDDPDPLNNSDNSAVQAEPVPSTDQVPASSSEDAAPNERPAAAQAVVATAPVELVDPFENPLKSLMQALTYVQDHRSQKEHQEPDEPVSPTSVFQAPLESLEAVLTQLAPAQEPAVAAKSTGNGAFFEFDELDELEEQIEQEHLAVLEGVLRRAKRPALQYEQHVLELQSVLSQVKPKHDPEPEPVKRFEQPLLELQSVLRQAKPKREDAEPVAQFQHFEQPLLDLQRVLKQAKPKNDNVEPVEAGNQFDRPLLDLQSVLAQVQPQNDRNDS